jgi:uncharacterized protein YdhG (YjbR/CyaY superfamily)
MLNHVQDEIGAYIAKQAEHLQPILNQVRSSIREVLPNAQERISYGIPSYWDRQYIIHFAAFKKHIGIYPGPKAIEHFAKQLSGYKTRKGAIQFPYQQEIPLELIVEITNWCYQSINNKIK